MSVATNADQGELDKFSQLAHRWWDPHGEFRPLHDINPLRLQWIEQHVSLSGATVLDIGCGGGILSEAMSVRGASVTGIDLSQKALRVAELHQIESGAQVRYELASAEEYAARSPQSFDAITCMELLEHVPDPSSTVAACARLVKPGGQVFFSTINRTPKAYLFAVLGAEYVLGLLPKGTHDYARFIKPSELAAWCRECELRTEEIIGMSYNPLAKTYRLGRNCDVNYLLHGKSEA